MVLLNPEATRLGSTQVMCAFDGRISDFPICFFSAAFGLESSLERGLFSSNCLLALVGQNRSSD